MHPRKAKNIETLRAEIVNFLFFLKLQGPDDNLGSYKKECMLEKYRCRKNGEIR